MKPHHIIQALDIIANREIDASTIYSGGGDVNTGFSYLVNKDYVLGSIDPIYGWKAALDEIERLHNNLREVKAAPDHVLK